MWPVVVSGLIAFVSGLAVAYFTFWIQRKRKVVEYAVSSTSLVPRELGNSPLRLTVDQAVLTGLSEDSGTFVPVRSAHTFSISLRNTGNDDIDSPTVRITIEDKATIVQPETKPERDDGYEIVGHPSQAANSLSYTFPYINAGDEVSISFTAIGTQSSRCAVQVFAKGVKVNERQGARNRVARRNTPEPLLLRISLVLIGAATAAGIISTAERLFDLSYEPSATVTGAVYQQGRPFANGRVQLDRKSSAQTAANGTFRFTNVPSGSHVLDVFTQQGAFVTSTSFTVEREGDVILPGLSISTGPGARPSSPPTTSTSTTSP